jgi:predicted nucleic acid-binding protein
MGLILDSTVFIDAERAARTVTATLERLRRRFRDAEVAMSPITAAELVHGVWRAVDPAIRTRRESFVEEVFSRVPVRSVSLETARTAGRLDAATRARGETVPVADLWIGATALELGFAVATGNPRHFRRIPGLRTHVVH